MKQQPLQQQQHKRQPLPNVSLFTTVLLTIAVVHKGRNYVAQVLQERIVKLSLRAVCPTVIYLMVSEGIMLAIISLYPATN